MRRTISVREIPRTQCPIICGHRPSIGGRIRPAQWAGILVHGFVGGLLYLCPRGDQYGRPSNLIKDWARQGSHSTQGSFTHPTQSGVSVDKQWGKLRP